MIVVTVREGDGVYFLFLGGGLECQANTPVEFRMHAGIHEQTVTVDFHEPGAGTDVRIWIQVDDFHRTD